MIIGSLQRTYEPARAGDVSSNQECYRCQSEPLRIPLAGRRGYYGRGDVAKSTDLCVSAAA